MDITQFVRYLIDVHFIDIFVPFLLIFSIIYAVLWVSKKTGILPIEHNIQIIIAAAISIIAITPHVVSPGSRFDIVAIMLEILPNVGLLFLGTLVVLMLMGFIGGKAVGKNLRDYFTIGIIIFIAYLFLVSLNILPTITGVQDSTISALIALFVFWLVVSYITGDDKEETEEELKQKKKQSYLGIIEGNNFQDDE